MFENIIVINTVPWNSSNDSLVSDIDYIAGMVQVQPRTAILIFDNNVVSSIELDGVSY